MIKICGAVRKIQKVWRVLLKKNILMKKFGTRLVTLFRMQHAQRHLMPIQRVYSDNKWLFYMAQSQCNQLKLQGTVVPGLVLYHQRIEPVFDRSPVMRDIIFTICNLGFNPPRPTKKENHTTIHQINTPLRRFIRHFPNRHPKAKQKLDPIVCIKLNQQEYGTVFNKV
jgi:hypothetical protein